MADIDMVVNNKKNIDIDINMEIQFGEKKDNLGQLTQMWVDGVRWSQTFINHCFMAYLTIRIG